MSETSYVEVVGGYAMSVAIAPSSPDAAQRWNQRAEVLAQWLLSEWQRKQCRPVVPSRDASGGTESSLSARSLN